MRNLPTLCVDTGAHVSVIPKSAYKPKNGKLSATYRDLLGAGDTGRDSWRQFLKAGKNLVKEKVYVVRGTPKLLLGILAIRHLGLIHDILGKHVTKAIKEKVSPPPLRSKEDVLKAYPKLFTGLGKLKGEYNIRLNEDAKPFCMTSPRRVPLPVLGRLEKEITRWTILDVIEPAEEPTECCASVIVVPKSNGDIGCVLIWQSKVICRNQIEHDERLGAVLDRLQEEGITLNYKKCVFFVSRLEYLG